jgi:transposase
VGGFEKKARREHRTLLLWDETGHSFRARPGPTWARRGLTPVLRRLSKRREVSSVVAITPDGRLYARHFRTSVSSRTVILALRYFRRQIGTPLLVIWDRLNAHRSRATTGFIAAHAQDYAVAYLPAYAPELNPEEQCNAFVKRALANALPDSVADLHRLARREFVRLQSRPKMIVSFFRHAGLSVAGLP